MRRQRRGQQGFCLQTVWKRHCVRCTIASKRISITSTGWITSAKGNRFWEGRGSIQEILFLIPFHENKTDCGRLLGVGYNIIQRLNAHEFQTQLPQLFNNMGYAFVYHFTVSP